MEASAIAVPSGYARWKGLPLMVSLTGQQDARDTSPRRSRPPVPGRQCRPSRQDSSPGQTLSLKQNPSQDREAGLP